MRRTVSASTDIELLFDFRASLFGLYQPVAKRRHCSVPESLARMLLHRPEYMLGVLFRLVFIEKGDDLPHHGVHGFSFVADRLGHRDDPDAMFRELSEIELLLERLSEEPAIAVNDNTIKRLPAIAGAFDHLMEDRSAIISGGYARFDKLGDQRVTVGVTPRPELPALIGNRKVVLGLPTGRDAHIESGPGGGGGRFVSKAWCLVLAVHLRRLAFHNPFSHWDEFSPTMVQPDWSHSSRSVHS
jgi:hypothetical protein